MLQGIKQPLKIEAASLIETQYVHSKVAALVSLQASILQDSRYLSYCTRDLRSVSAAFSCTLVAGKQLHLSQPSLQMRNRCAAIPLDGDLNEMVSLRQGKRRGLSRTGQRLHKTLLNLIKKRRTTPAEFGQDDNRMSDSHTSLLRATNPKVLTARLMPFDALRTKLLSTRIS